jgi:hypothetical protein
MATRSGSGSEQLEFTRITLFGLTIRPYTLTGYGNYRRASSIGGGLGESNSLHDMSRPLRLSSDIDTVLTIRPVTRHEVIAQTTV